MKKAQLPQPAELDLGHTEDFTPNSEREFAGIANPRHLRTLHALLHRPLTREQLDRIAGASNGPEVVAQLRRLGLELPCTLDAVIDRDGRVVRRGTYTMTADDRHKVCAFFASRRVGMASGTRQKARHAL